MTTKQKVFATGKMSGNMMALSRKYLIPGAEMFFYEKEGDREQHIPAADVLVVYNSRLTKEWLDRAARCIFIQRYGAGVDTVDLPEACRRGIPVGITSGKNARSVAEHAVMLMLAVHKRLITAHCKIVHEGKWLNTVLRDTAYEISYKKVGIVGMGNIGRLVAKMLSGFECEVAYYDVFRLPEEEEKALGVTYADLDSLIQRSDIVTIHAPLTEQTHHVIDERRLHMMKPSAVLINTSRGGLVDEKALVEALQSGRLRGAGLDVFEKEPIDREHPLAKMENVIVTPHTAGGTNESMEAVVQEAFVNINSMLQNRTLANEKNIVNLKDLPKKAGAVQL